MNESDARTRGAERAWLPLPALVLFLMAAAPNAQALDFPMRWQPSPTTGVTGYKLYVRQDGTSFGSGTSVGLPTRAIDGTMSATLTGLQPGPRYCFAVSAVAMVGGSEQESRLSNEICTCTTDAQCDDGNACTNDACDAGACRSTAISDGTPCSDSNVCNGDETCRSGTCAPGTALACTDGNACTTDGCNPSSGCTFNQIAGCRPCQTASQCDDANPCTTDSCTARGTCANTLNSNCAACTSDQQCDDGNRCNGNETCEQGTCTHGTALACGDGNGCTTDACRPSSGCVYTPISGCRPCQTVTQCDDGNPCTTDSCTQRGTCTNVLIGSCALCTADDQCDDHNPCTTDSCTGGRCRSLQRPTGESCSDGNPCNGEETCQAGKCTAGSFPCDDHDPCTADRCTRDDGCTHDQNASCATCEGVPQAGFEPQLLAFYSGGKKDRLTAMGVLDPTRTVDPTRTGILMEVRDRDGTGDVVYGIYVPPGAFKANPSRRTFRLDPRRARQLRADGLQRLNLVITSDGTTRIYVKTYGLRFDAEFPKGYTWSVLFGDQCAVADCYLRSAHGKCD